jgi:hypothetical protein
MVKTSVKRTPVNKIKNNRLLRPNERETRNERRSKERLRRVRETPSPVRKARVVINTKYKAGALKRVKRTQAKNKATKNNGTNEVKARRMFNKMMTRRKENAASTTIQKTVRGMINRKKVTKMRKLQIQAVKKIETARRKQLLRREVAGALGTGNVRAVVSRANSGNLVPAAAESRIINITRRLCLNPPKVIASIVITVLYLTMLTTNPRYPDDVIDQFLQYEGSRVQGRILGINRGKDPHWFRKWQNVIQPFIDKFYQTQAETVYRGIFVTWPKNNYGRSLAGREIPAVLYTFFCCLIIYFPTDRRGAEEAIRLIALAARELGFVGTLIMSINFFTSRSASVRNIATQIFQVGREIAPLIAAAGASP